MQNSEKVFIADGSQLREGKNREKITILSSLGNVPIWQHFAGRFLGMVGPENQI